MRALLLVGLALVAGCGPRPAPKPLSLRLLDMKALEPMPYIESPMFSVHYYVFQDQTGQPWGEGRVLAAYWRKELGFESRLGGLGAVRGGLLAVETPKERGLNMVLRLDERGIVASSAAFSGAFDQFFVLRARGGDLFAVRSSREVSVLEPGGKLVWLCPEPSLNIKAADLDGDGQDELLVQDQKGGLAAYDARGKRLWSRSGLPELDRTASGRLAGRAEAWLVARTGGWSGDGRLLALDARGRVAVSTPVAWSEAALTAIASGRVAAVGHAYPEERDFLSLSTLGERPAWRSDLGWAAASALAAADLDGDGRDEIALGTTNGWVLVFSDEGKLLSEKNFQGEISHLVAADMKGDGKRQLLVALKGIPPQIYAVGVVPAPGPWHK